ncbi:MAG: beta-lactamase family protein [Flavobacteriaceae bacterium]
MIRIAILIILLFVSNTDAFSQKTNDNLSNSDVKKIDNIFKSFNNTESPGVTISFIKNNALIFSKSYGMADLEHTTPIHSNSVFSLASVSKQFTVFAILLLEERGKLSLEDDIKKYLPLFPNYQKKITIRHLATHTSGVKSHEQLLAQKGYISDNVITKRDALAMIYKQDELNFNPGEEFNYSNAGYVLLAEIVEKVTGTSFAKFLKKEIFEPLSMKNSFVMDDYHKIVKNRANSYEIENGEYVNAPANYSYYGSTGLYTTAMDLTKWALNFSNLNIGSKRIFRKMKTLSKLNNNNTFGYALGQFVGKYRGAEYIYHSGGDAGYRTFLGRFPETNSAVLLLSNNNTVNAQELALKVVDVFMKSYDKPKSNSSLSNRLTSKIIKLPTSQLEKYSGHYLSQSSYIIRDIFVRNDTLIYSRKEQNNRETPLFSLKKEHTFQLGDYKDLWIQFSNDNSQKRMKIFENQVQVDVYNAYSPRRYSRKELEGFTGVYYSKSLDTKYMLEIKGGILIVIHPKMGEIMLSAIKNDGFLASSWQFRFLEFKRNKENQIIGFSITSDRVRNTRFTKVKIKT